MTLVVESLFGARGLSAMMQARREYAVLANDLDRIRGENQRLQAEARRLREDPTAIEEAARRDLGYMAPGEKVFILHDAKPAPTTPDSAQPKRSKASADRLARRRRRWRRPRRRRFRTREVALDVFAKRSAGRIAGRLQRGMRGSKAMTRTCTHGK